LAHLVGHLAGSTLEAEFWGGAAYITQEIF
jgi:hypothetical protein